MRPTNGDCEDMFNFLFRKGYDANYLINLNSDDLYSLAKKEGYQEPHYIGKL